MKYDPLGIDCGILVCTVRLGDDFAVMGRSLTASLTASLLTL
jgi:hypothetical protein